MKQPELDEKQRYALMFCLAYSDPESRAIVSQQRGQQGVPVPGAILALRDAAMWALRQTDEEPSEELQQREFALVYGGAARIKAYVYESARLPEIRGASVLLDRVNMTSLPQLWADLGCEACIIYAGGGEILAFAPASEGDRLADEIERCFARETLTAEAAAVTERFTLRELRDGRSRHGVTPEEEKILPSLLGAAPEKKGPFGDLVSWLALARFRRREQNETSGRTPVVRQVAHFETIPFARRCGSCERRAAVETFTVGDDPRALCEPCLRKRAAGMWAKMGEESTRKWKARHRWTPEALDVQPWSRQFTDWLQSVDRQTLRNKYTDNGNVPCDLNELDDPRDLNEIGLCSDLRGFIGLIYADGNNLGGLLESQRTPGDYRQFSEAVSDAVRDALFNALASRLNPRRVTGQDGEERWVHPFEILGLGGDDVLVIVPAHAALDVALAISRSAEAQLRTLLSKPAVPDIACVHRCRPRPDDRDTQSAVSLSAGVVLAADHTPVYYLEQMASDLLKLAKGKAKYLRAHQEYWGATIDFLALKSIGMVTGSVAQFRRNTQEKTNPARSLTARPYTLTEMETLLDSVRDLKRASFPRTQLARLRQSLGEGFERSAVDYFYFMSRGEDARTARKAIEERWGGRSRTQPWLAADAGIWETIWHDIAELYDFVSEGE